MKAILAALRAWFRELRERRARQIAIERARVQCAALCQDSWAAAERGDWTTYVRLRSDYAKQLKELERTIEHA